MGDDCLELPEHHQNSLAAETSGEVGDSSRFELLNKPMQPMRVECLESTLLVDGRSSTRHEGSAIPEMISEKQLTAGRRSVLRCSSTNRIVIA